MILETQGPRQGPSDMTIYRQRSSSHSSQQSWGSTSGDSASGDSSSTPYSLASSMNGQGTHYYMNGPNSSGSETMLNGYHTPPPYVSHNGRGDHPLAAHNGTGTYNAEMTPPSPPRRYSPSKYQKHIPPRQHMSPNLHHEPLGRVKSLDNDLSPLNGAHPNQEVHPDLSQSYDTSMAKILELHRNLAQSYTTHQTKSEPKLGSRNCYSNTLHHELQADYNRDEPPMIPARKSRSMDQGRPVLNGGGGYQMNHVRRKKMDLDIDSCHSNSTSTPSSSTPSTPTSEAAHGIPNGYATIRGKPPKFNLHTISENLGQLFSKPGSKLRSGSSDDEQLSPAHSSTPLKASRPRSNSIGNFLGLSSLMGTSTEDEIDSDENNDDYGFLSPLYTSLHSSINTTPSSSSVAMHKAKSPTPAHRIIPKKWRKPKLLTPSGAVTKTTSIWKPKVGQFIFYQIKM